jgi:hypothetical protein
MFVSLVMRAESCVQLAEQGAVVRCETRFQTSIELTALRQSSLAIDHPRDLRVNLCTHLIEPREAPPWGVSRVKRRIEPNHSGQSLFLLFFVLSAVVAQDGRCPQFTRAERRRARRKSG